MKNLIKFFSFAALVVFATACTPDPCKDVVCGDHGTCEEGLCICETGYEQNTDGLCNTEVRAKFLGTWTVSEDCTQSAPSSYTTSVTISSGAILEVKITNMWGAFANQVTATVSGSTITIARQAPDSDSYYIEGSGTISGSTITMNYTVTDETDTSNIITDVCSSSSWVR